MNFSRRVLKVKVSANFLPWAELRLDFFCFENVGNDVDCFEIQILTWSLCTHLHKSDLLLFIIQLFISIGTCGGLSQFTIFSISRLTVDIFLGRNQHNSSVGRAPALWPGGCEFDPRLNHTKGIWYYLLFCLVLSIMKGARNQNWSARFQYKVTGWNIMSCVQGMILQRGSTLKVSIELLFYIQMPSPYD